MVARLTKALKTEENNANDGEEYDENNEKPAEEVSGVNDGDGGGDIDMADIVVIDEYDSTKPDVRKVKNVSSSVLFNYYCIVNAYTSIYFFFLGRTKTNGRT